METWKLCRMYNRAISPLIINNKLVYIHTNRLIVLAPRIYMIVRMYVHVVGFCIECTCDMYTCIETAREISRISCPITLT